MKQAMKASRLAINWFYLLMSRRDQSRKAKPCQSKSRPSRLMLACAVVFTILLLLLRMLVFVRWHGRR
jgi:hypothetical protein